jgi:hypothetical protein
MRSLLVAIVVVLITLPAQAANYYDQKWFDYPDPATLPRTTSECAKQACTDIPEFSGLNVTMVTHCVCVNPIVKVELLRRDVRVIVSGPDTSDDAVKKAVVGYATGCVVGAIGGSTAGPQIVASPGEFFALFKACITAISATGMAGSIINQFNIHLNTTQTHWSPL